MTTGRDAKGHFIKGSKINQGRVPSAEQRRKQAEAMTGRVESDEHKDKIRVAMVKAAAEGRLKIGIKGSVPWNKGNGVKKIRFLNDAKFKKGLIPWNKGKSWPPEMIEKMSVAHKNITDETRTKMSKAKIGIQHSAETVRKMLTRRTPTSLEMKFLGIIEKNNLPYKFVGDGSFMIGRKNPDFININREKIAIEVYARYYKLRHAETVQEWKEERQKVFREYGWEAIFFDETQVKEKNVLKQLGIV